MAYLTREDIPFHYALADAFTVCDAYHCSFIGSTDPNRYYMWTGYTGNDGKGGGPVLGNDELGYDWTTYPERLEAAGVSWKIYQDIGDGLDAAGSWGWIKDAYRGNYGDNSLLYFNTYRNAQPGDPLYDKARTGTNVKAGDGYFDLLRADVEAGTLPADLLDRRPRGVHRALELADELRRLVHLAGPGRADLQPGGVGEDRPVHHLRRERRLLRPRRPAATRRPPPRRGLSTVDVALRPLHGRRRATSAGPYGLGPRVPMLVVSPVEQGRLRLLRDLRPHLDPPVHGAALRGARAQHLAVAARRLRRPDLGLRLLPQGRRARRAAGHRRLRAAGPGPPPRLQARPRRPTRACPGRSAARARPAPLGYAPYVDGSADPSTGKFTLTFASGAERGRRTSTVTSGNRTDGPWHVHHRGGQDRLGHLEHQRTPTASYDLTVHGPNGFLRVFEGPGRRRPAPR